jgi:hypothetical protein
MVIVQLEGLGELKKPNDLIGNRTRDFPACSIVPQPTTLPRALKHIPKDHNIYGYLRVSLFRVVHTCTVLSRRAIEFLVNYYEIKWLNEVEINERNW